MTESFISYNCEIIHMVAEFHHSDSAIYYIGMRNILNFQDLKMEVLCHIRPYFVGRFPYIGLA